MRKGTFLNLLAVLVITVLQSCSAGNGWVQVDGNKFIGPDGKEIIFRGLCFSDPVKLVRDRQWNERYFDEASRWGANVVRFAVHPQNTVKRTTASIIIASFAVFNILSNLS